MKALISFSVRVQTKERRCFRGTNAALLKMEAGLPVPNDAPAARPNRRAHREQISMPAIKNERQSLMRDPERASCACDTASKTRERS